MVAVSIVICTRNRATKLGPMLDALGRVRSALSWEVLLIDNASTDNTREVLAQAVAENPNCRSETVSRIGLGAARDAAWRMARGEIILFTDDDCYVEPDVIDAVAEAFRKYPDAGVIGGRIMLHDPSDYPVTIDESTEERVIAPHRYVPAGALQGANLSFRRETLEAIGGIDLQLGAGTAFPCEDIAAVADGVWAGYSARFDPTIVVRHHHGRKAADLPDIMASYNAGRGAYYARFLLRKDSRIAYLKGWYGSVRGSLTVQRLGKIPGEFISALRYFSKRKAFGAWLALLLFAPPTYAFLWVHWVRYRLFSGGSR